MSEHDVDVRRIGPDEATDLLTVVQAAFAARPALDPPADAMQETVESLAERLAAYGGLLATLDGTPVGGLVLDPVGRSMYVRRFGVTPEAQGTGVAWALIEAAVEVTLADSALDFDDLTVVARSELPATVGFWERQGFREVRRHAPNVELRRPLRTYVVDVPTPDDMRALAQGLAQQCRPGDLLVLTGELGAGKTTFTQGLGQGLDVRGSVTSPTFVIARVHPSLVDGPPLVHVDAYRLGGVDELDDLDLDTALDDAVTVVEWGEGVAEALSDSRLEVRIRRAMAHVDEADHDPRHVLLTPVGPRWYDLALPGHQGPITPHHTTALP